MHIFIISDFDVSAIHINLVIYEDPKHSDDITKPTRGSLVLLRYTVNCIATELLMFLGNLTTACIFL
jgi:hypothetical protein